jgi:hypothetical protein
VKVTTRYSTIYTEHHTGEPPGSQLTPRPTRKSTTVSTEGITSPVERCSGLSWSHPRDQLPQLPRPALGLEATALARTRLESLSVRSRGGAEGGAWGRFGLGQTRGDARGSARGRVRRRAPGCMLVGAGGYTDVHALAWPGASGRAGYCARPGVFVDACPGWPVRRCRCVFASAGVRAHVGGRVVEGARTRGRESRPGRRQACEWTRGRRWALSPSVRIRIPPLCTHERLH